MSKRYCIFDTEYTTWPDAWEKRYHAPGQHRELTQIGAAIVEPGQAWSDVKTFNALIKPVLNPVLDAFAVDFTGITQARLEEEGLETAEALEKFADFVGDMAVFSNGMDINVLAETCGLQKIVMPLEPRRFGSLSRVLYPALRERFTFERKDYPSGKVHQLVGIDVPQGLGQVHDALRDVWSLFVTMEWLERDGARVWEKLT